MGSGLGLGPGRGLGLGPGPGLGLARRRRAAHLREEVDEAVAEQVEAGGARVEEGAPPPLVVLVAQLEVAEHDRDLGAPGRVRRRRLSAWGCRLGALGCRLGAWGCGP